MATRTLTRLDAKKLAKTGTHREVCSFLHKHGLDPKTVGLLVEHIQKPAAREAKAWEAEPDLIYLDRSAYNCAIARLEGGELGGYFGVPKDNPFFGEFYEIYHFFRGPADNTPDCHGFQAHELKKPLLSETHFYFAFSFANNNFRPDEDQLEREEMSYNPALAKPVDLIADLEDHISPLRIIYPDLPVLPDVTLVDSGMLVYRDVTYALLVLKDMCDRMDMLVRLFNEHPELNELKTAYRYAKYGPLSPLEYYPALASMYSEVGDSIPRSMRYSPETEELAEKLIAARFLTMCGWDYAKSKEELPILERRINALLDTVLPE